MFLSNLPSRLDNLSRLSVILILTILGVLAFANAVRHPFVHDDVVFIRENPHINDLDLGNLFFQTSGPDSGYKMINKYYRPLLELVNRLLFRLVGFDPHGFHLFNVVLHIVNGVMVFLVLQRALGGQGLALVSAVLFTVHPVQNEAVACISGISNLMFTFLCLLSFWAYLKAVHPPDGSANKGLYAFSLALFLLALFAKEQSVVLPFLIIVYELCFANGSVRERIRQNGGRVTGFFCVLAAYFALRKWLFGFALLRPADNQGELWIRVLAVPRSLLVYLGLIVFPHDLHYYRSQNILLPWVAPALLLSAVMVLIAVLVWRTPRPQRTWMVFGLAWFLIALGPTLNIVPLINEYATILTSEHFLYLPLVGMALFIGAAGHYWVGQKAKRLVPAVSAAFLGLVVLFVGMNIRQNMYWRGEVPLFERTLRYQKDFGRVRFLLAKAYLAEGRTEDAVREGRKALAIMKGYEQSVRDDYVKEFYRGFIKGIHYHLGYCLDLLGRHREALQHFQGVLELEPDNGAVHYSMGLTYVKLGDKDKAIESFERAVAVGANDLMAINALAVCYQERGEYGKAEPLLRMIVEKDGSSVSAKRNLAVLLEKMEKGFQQEGSKADGTPDH